MFSLMNVSGSVRQVACFSTKRNVSNVSIAPFYQQNDLYKFDNKNVIYIAYVGNFNNEDVYKYGKSAKLFEREYNAHRRNFDTFNMQCVKITDNKDVIEDMLEKELLIRNMHRTITINSKKQTELFATSEAYPLEYVIRMLKRLIKDNPSFQVATLQAKVAMLKAKLKELSDTN
jgi:hypothetical protein